MLTLHFPPLATAQDMTVEERETRVRILCDRAACGLDLFPVLGGVPQPVDPDTLQSHQRTQRGRERKLFKMLMKSKARQLLNRVSMPSCKVRIRVDDGWTVVTVIVAPKAG